MKFVEALAVVAFVVGCGDDSPAIDECSAVAGAEEICVYGPSCPASTRLTDNGAVDANGFPVYACADEGGRAVIDCVVRYPDGSAAGLCR